MHGHILSNERLNFHLVNELLESLNTQTYAICYVLNCFGCNSVLLYSKTCVKRPLMGNGHSGLLRQVVTKEC